MPEPTVYDKFLERTQDMDDDELTSILDALDAPPDEGEDETDQAPADFSSTPEGIEMQRRIDELEARNRKTEAEAFVDWAVRDGLAFPAERDRLVARYAQFSLDDERDPAEFARGKPHSRVAEFKADILRRTPHNLTTEQVANFGHVLSNGPAAPDEEAAAKARTTELLNHTSVGQAALAALKN